MIAELADGKQLRLPDNTTDAEADAIVMLHIQVGQLVKEVEILQESIRRMEAAFLSPRKITLERNFADDKVTGATSTVVKRN
jgi:hypothetical protein